jgi:DNA gyrase subunit B
VDRGYLYIAQPPLFKVGKGKSEKYIKDESDYNDWILKKICDQKTVNAGNDEIKISGHRFYLFICDLFEYFLQMTKLTKRGIPSTLAELLIDQGVGNKQFLQDQDRMSALRELFVKRNYLVDNISWNEQRGVFEMMVRGYNGTRSEGITAPAATKSFTPIKIGRGLIFSSDYQKCLVTGKNIAKYDFPPFNIYNKDKAEPIGTAQDKKQLLDFLLKEGKKGVNVQRYKGLGEMNPEQLWQTTMNPEKRNLLQVKVEDIVDTDEIFNILMGEEVEPRREFIQNNALEVSALDI